MSEVIEWLESPEGETWSKAIHDYGMGKVLVMLKDDMGQTIEEIYPVFLWVA